MLALLAVLQVLQVLLQTASVLGESCDPAGCSCASTPLISVECNQANLEVGIKLIIMKDKTVDIDLFPDHPYDLRSSSRESTVEL